MYHDQVRFILGIEYGFNIQKTTNAIHQINRLNKRIHITISMEAQSAFYDVPTYLRSKLSANETLFRALMSP